jgi:hypothetical protein
MFLIVRSWARSLIVLIWNAFLTEIVGVGKPLHIPRAPKYTNSVGWQIHYGLSIAQDPTKTPACCSDVSATVSAGRAMIAVSRSMITETALDRLSARLLVAAGRSLLCIGQVLVNCSRSLSNLAGQKWLGLSLTDAH